MGAEALSRTVVAEDARLEKQAEGSRLALAEHRWHWTLDETNTMRVTVAAYARGVGRNHSTIADMVNGFASWKESGGAPESLSDELVRAKLRGDTRTATEAVAKARNISVEAARRHHAPEVREVKAAAQERVERKPETTIEEATREVAAFRVKAAASEKKNREDKQAAHSFRYVSAEGKIAVAMRNLRWVLQDSEGVEYSAEELELLAESLGRLRALLNLLDVRLMGATDVDWDAEMAKLTGGVL